MQITGRVTADAEVRSTKSEKKVVGFNVAVNRSFMSNGERKTETKFFECSYWRGDGIAAFLKKGTLVELSGEVGAYAYLDKKSGDPVAVLTLHVDNIVLHGRAKEVHSVFQGAEGQGNGEDVHAIDAIASPEGDLPF